MTHFTIDNLNYARDSRTGDPAPTKLTVYDPDSGDDVEIEIPSKWDVCPVCDGKGTHVNPSIDAGGLSRDSMDDPEFMDDYMSGAYDQTCNYCQGRTTVRVPDEDAMSDADRKLWYDHLRDEAAYEAECQAEIRMGC